MEIGLRVARRTVFQGLASIVLPAVTIHSAVKYSAPIFLKSSNPKIKGWGPTVWVLVLHHCRSFLRVLLMVPMGEPPRHVNSVGLAIVPLLPVMFDHPVEHVSSSHTLHVNPLALRRVVGPDTRDTWLAMPDSTSDPVVLRRPWLQLTDKTFDYIEENWLGCTEEARGARRKHAEAGSNTPKGKSEL